jgi:hypothetical protein
MNKKFYALLSISILILVFVAIPTFANHPWANYHWERSSNPVLLTIGDNMDSNWDPYLNIAVADWNQSNVLGLTIGAGSGNTRRCKSNASNNIQVCNDTYGNTGWLGLASISVSGDHITFGSAKMNDTYFNTPQYDTPEWRLFVTCQEIGHAFGLGHQDEAFDNANLGTCMDYTSDPGLENDPDNNLHPNQHDYGQLETIYAHLDGSGGGGGGGGEGCFPPNSRKCRGQGNNGNGNGNDNGNGNNASEWGQLVRQNGRIAVYERDFGNGNRVITFVIWAN